MRQVEVDTPHGPARAHLHAVAGPAGALILGHGAGGGVQAPDLIAATEAANEAGWSVALVEQPYRVAARRSSPPPARLDEDWHAVVAALREGELRRLPLVVGGRSAGARVACRTAAASGAVGVLCLAFPLRPPRRAPNAPPKTRQPELDAVEVPTLIVQGESDRFGMPRARPNHTLVRVRGDHGLKSDLPAVAAAVRGWLPTVL